MAQADMVVKVYPDTRQRLAEVQQVMAADGRRRQPPTLDEVINELIESHTRWLALAADMGES